MKPKKPRGWLWVSTTHVLTTAFAAAVCFALLAVPASLVTSMLGPAVFFVMHLITQPVACGLGTLYSLSYLKKTTIVTRPLASTVASVVVFIAVALMGPLQMMFAMISSAVHPLAALIGELISFLACLTLFTLLTHKAIRTPEGPDADAQGA